jgi:DNA polymerase V
MPTHVTDIFDPDLSRPRTLPLFTSTVAAGFPSPADDYLERDLDLNEFFVRHATSTFYVRVSGDSMENAGIRHNDVLVVDKSLEPRNGSIVVAVIDGELTVKRLRRRDGEVHLMPENAKYQPILISVEQTFSIWGVVTGIARKLEL